MTAITRVDTSGEIHGDNTSIADLAQNSFGGAFGTFNSYLGNPAEAVSILNKDWKFELKDVARDHQQITATFKDGSKLIINADGICCSAGACPRCKETTNA